MRVLRVSHSAAVDEWRGRERGLRRLGVEVRLLSAQHSREGSGVVKLVARADEQVTGVATIGEHPALFVYDPRPLWRALGEKWDVIDIHEEPFALATAEILFLRWLRGNRSPVVLYTAQNLRKTYPIPFRWFERHSLRSAAGVSACNAEAARIAELKGFPGRARVIPLGLDETRFNPAASRVAQPGDMTTGEVTVGFIGRLVAEKGVSVLLEALALDPKLRARIAGSGPLLTSLHADAGARGVSDRVEIVGPVGPDDLVDFYRSVDVLAVPSLPTPTWTEQFGRVAVEAMGCGTPVVSSDAGALPDVVGAAGIVVPHGDARALAAALADAAGARAQELRAAGLVRAAECTWDAVADDYLDLYRSIHPRGTGGADRGLEIVTVAYGRPDLLRRALEPVVGLPVTVVDNSSLPEIAALCDDLGVRYIDPGRNGGFGAGVNEALADRLIPGGDVLLLNPDAAIEADQIAALHAALSADTRLASVAPAQIDEDGQPARVAWPFPSPANSWLEAIGLGRWQRGPLYVIGAVLLLRAEALAQVGGFDETFFLYAEETDWAYRAQLLGWHHRLIPQVVARHVGAGTSTDSQRRDAHFYASQEKYVRKHFGVLGWQSARAANWLGAIARSVMLKGERGQAARRRAALYWRGPVRAEGRLRES